MIPFVACSQIYCRYWNCGECWFESGALKVLVLVMGLVFRLKNN